MIWARGQEPERAAPLVNEHNSRNCFFVTDDLDPEDILEKGHINNLVRTAINKGLDPIRAIQMATITRPRIRLKELGRVAPGSLADLLILDDLKQVSIARVYQSGRLVAEAGKLVVPSVSRGESQLPDSMNVAWDRVKDFSVKAEGTTVNIIQVVPGQIITKRVAEPAPSRMDWLWQILRGTF
jgi:adenine deaminase